MQYLDSILGMVAGFVILAGMLYGLCRFQRWYDERH